MLISLPNQLCTLKRGIGTGTPKASRAPQISLEVKNQLLPLFKFTVSRADFVHSPCFPSPALHPLQHRPAPPAPSSPLGKESITQGAIHTRVLQHPGSPRRSSTEGTNRPNPALFRRSDKITAQGAVAAGQGSVPINHFLQDHLAWTCLSTEARQSKASFRC